MFAHSQRDGQEQSMPANKTQATKLSAKAFVEGIKDEKKREDAKIPLKVFAAATGENPVMWGPSIVGYGSYRYKYESGREGEICLVGFSPRAAAFTLYVHAEFSGRDAAFEKLGDHKTGKGCLYIKRLAGTNLEVLEEIVRKAYNHMRKKHKA
jgi:hypothetical protein